MTAHTNTEPTLGQVIALRSELARSVGLPRHRADDPPPATLIHPRTGRANPRLVTAVDTAAAEALADDLIHQALTAGANQIVFAEDEPCTRCDEAPLLGDLDDDGVCTSCRDARRQDDRDGYDITED